MSVPSPSSGSQPDADADARFAAYLEEVAASVDDPVYGETYRLILDDDPPCQRALFDFGEEISEPLPPAPPGRAVTIVALLASLALVLLVVTVVVLVVS